MGVRTGSSQKTVWKEDFNRVAITLGWKWGIFKPFYRPSGSGVVRVSGSAPWVPGFPFSLSGPLRGSQPRWSSGGCWIPSRWHQDLQNIFRYKGRKDGVFEPLERDPLLSRCLPLLFSLIL